MIGSMSKKDKWKNQFPGNLYCFATDKLKLDVKFDSNPDHGPSLNQDKKYQIVIPASVSSILRDINVAKSWLGRDIAHELGHYLIAPKGRRHRLNFGIPPKRYNVPRPQWDLDEAKAILVEHALLRHFGGKMALKHPLRMRVLLESVRSQSKKANTWFEKEGKAMLQQALFQKEK